MLREGWKSLPGRSTFGNLTSTEALQTSPSQTRRGQRYKWIALSNTTLGVLLATLDSSIVLIAMPDIFRGIHLDPLQPGNSFYLLWMIFGYLIVTSVLVVSFGRLGDIYGRVKMYNLGFVIYTAASLMLAIDWMTGTAGADWLIAFRIVQGVGAAFLLANSAAILTDAFPPHQRGMALGLNNVVAVAGMFVGLVLGGLLAPISWRLVFLISVPIGLFGTVWAYLKLEETGIHRRAPIDWLGNLTFAGGLVLIMIGVTRGIRPYAGHPMGWQNPQVIAELVAGVAAAGGICRGRDAGRTPDVQALAVSGASVHLRDAFELHVCGRARRSDVHPDHLAAGHLAAATRLQLRADAALGGHLHAPPDRWDHAGRTDQRLPLGPLRRAPVRNRRNARQRGLVRVAGAAADQLSLSGLRGGAVSDGSVHGCVCVAQSCRSDEQPATGRPRRRGRHEPDLQNSAQVLSIGIFFSLMIAGLAATLPAHMSAGLIAHGVPPGAAHQAANLPPVSILFAAFLGYNPIQHLVGAHVLSHVSPANVAVISGRGFFPELISGPFRTGLHLAFSFAITACLIAAVASWSRGRRYVDQESTVAAASAGAGD